MDREIASLSASLPQQLDHITTLTRVRHDPAQRRLIYEATLDLPAGVKLFSHQMKSHAVPETCADTALRDLLETGYALDFFYATPGGAALGGFSLVASDCE